MEKFELKSAAHAIMYIYKDIWKPSTGDKLIVELEFGNQFVKFVVKVLNSSARN